MVTSSVLLILATLHLTVHTLFVKNLSNTVMEKHFKPENVFSKDPNSQNADREFTHWRVIFEKYLSKIKVHENEELDKLGLLFNNVSAEVFGYISSETSYEGAMEILKNIYIRPKNTVFARFCLKDRKQGATESMDEYLRQLQILAKDCDYKSVSAQLYEEESIRDAFISGIRATEIRQRLLEETDTLDKTFEKARSLEQALKNNERYSSIHDSNNSIVNSLVSNQESKDGNFAAAAYPKKKGPIAGSSSQKCFFCGYDRHARSRCPARDKTCILCNKVGHFASVCNSVNKREHDSSKNVPNSHLSALSS